MKSIRNIGVLTLVCNIILLGNVAWGQDRILITTGELPPYAYTQKEQQLGIATQIAKELITRTGYEGNILVTPWARTIKESTHNQRLSYPIARLPYRETQYQWIGPILSDTFTFAVLKSNTQTFSNLESFKHLEIGVNRGAPTERRLKEHGFQNLYSVSSEIKNAQMLLRDRFDVWYTTQLIITHTMNLLEQDVNQLRLAFTDLKIDMYIVASLDVAIERVQEWQTQLDAMKTDGTYNAILKKYGVRQELGFSEK